MIKKQEAKIDAYIFIDTNILLDFYRIRRTDVSMKYLKEIEKHKGIIISTSQVEPQLEHLSRKQKQVSIFHQPKILLWLYQIL